MAHNLYPSIAVVSAVDPLGRKSEPRVNRGRNGSACGGVEIRIRQWVNIIDHRYIAVVGAVDPLLRPPASRVDGLRSGLRLRYRPTLDIKMAQYHCTLL